MNGQNSLAQATQLAGKIGQINQEVLAINIGKEELLNVIWLGLITSRPVFAFGGVGINKTKTIQAAIKRIAGANFYEQLIPQLRSASQLFVEATSIKEETLVDGAKSISVEEQLGLALDAHVFYGDEFFKKPDHPALSELIDYTLGGFIRQGGKVVQSNLKLFVASGNETPDPAGEIGATWARMTLRVLVTSLNENQRRQMLVARTSKQQNQTSSTVNSNLTLEEVEILREAFPFVELPNEVLDKVFEVYSELSQRTDQDFSLLLNDDRRFARISDVLRAYALLNGRDKVSNNDIVVLKWMLWDKAEHIPVLMEVLAPYIRTALTEATELVDALLAPDSSLMKAKAGDVNHAAGGIKDAKDTVQMLGELKQEAGQDQTMAQAIENLITQVKQEQQALFNSLTGN